jgi:broad specificity phosphatase PhoE
MKLYFVRHGESQANLLHEFSNRGLRHGLTDRGRQQATALAEKLEGLSITRLYSSPLLRAIETAEILACRLDIQYATTDALREYDCGILEGKSDAASWALYQAVFDDWIRHGSWQQRIEGGESFLSIKERFVPFVQHLIAENEHPQACIVLVGHGGIYRCMLPLVLVKIGFGYAIERPIHNTGYVLAELKPQGLVCLSWCGTRVLSPKT